MLRLLIISHTPHYRRDHKIVGWGPTVREIDHLSRLFSEITHLAPLYQVPAPVNALPYGSTRVRLRPVSPAGGKSLRNKLQILQCWPGYLRTMWEEMSFADAVHVRCPANISLSALIMLAFRKTPRLRWVKYAGNWHPREHDHASYALQRWWLRKNLHKGSVTINGRWHGQSEHIRTFNNPSLTRDELLHASNGAAAKMLREPINILFVGALNRAKGAGRVLQIARALDESGVSFHLHLLGDGPERTQFQYEAKVIQLGGCVSFHGWVSKEELAAYYARAHFLLLPSITEGWPKVMSEAMAFGVVPLASDVGSIPQILTETQAGRSFPAENVGAFADAILDFVSRPALWKEASRAGLAAAHRFTYDHYLAAVGEMFSRVWGTPLTEQGVHIVNA